MMLSYDDVIMRTIVDLPEDQLAALDALARRDRVSRAATIRRAVALLVRAERGQAAGSAFGIWRDRREDGRAYQDRVRAEEWPE